MRRRGASGVLPAVETDDVADRVDCDLVEAAVVAHPARELRGARAVRVGEIGHRQLAALGVAGVAVRCERLGPVPHQVAERRDDAEALVEPDLGDAVDVAQALGALEVGVVLEAAREGRDDLVLAQALAARPAHGEDEREAELRPVSGVERADPRQLFGRARGEPGARLLVARRGRERVRRHRLAGELGVGADQGELLVLPGVADDLDQRALERGDGRERPARRRGFGDPRRVLVDALEQAREVGRRGTVELLEIDHRFACQTNAVLASNGWVALQWRAMSIRRGTQTRSCAAT